MDYKLEFSPLFNIENGPLLSCKYKYHIFALLNIAITDSMFCRQQTIPATVWLADVTTVCFLFWTVTKMNS